MLCNDSPAAFKACVFSCACEVVVEEVIYQSIEIGMQSVAVTCPIVSAPLLHCASGVKTDEEVDEYL